MVWNPAYRNLRQLGRTGLACLAGAVGLAGCASVGPDYAAPQLDMAEHWQAALPHNGQTHSLLGWWQRFNDPVLSELLAQAEADSPSLAESVARIDEARAGLSGANAAQMPSVNASVRQVRNNGNDVFTVPTQTTRGSAVDAQWEIDLFGRVRRGSEAANARLEGAQDGWHAARTSLAAEVANKYVNYRACQMTAAAFERDVQSRNETARITNIAAQAGLSAPADAQLARAGAAEMAGGLTAQQAACDITIKSLVTLTGLREPDLRARLQRGKPSIPRPPEFSVAALPVALLAQRPDLAASERQLAAASAEVGIAAANRYPRLALVGNLTRDKAENNGVTSLSKPWYFGPTLSLPLFNGGALAAQQDAAQARYAQALARYRQAVRGAVEEVETTLVLLDSAQRRAEQAQISTQGFNAYFKAAEIHWRAGGISLLALEEARRSATAAERSEIALQRERTLNWIGLYKALGGGWAETAPAQPDAAAPAKAAEPAPASPPASTPIASLTPSTPGETQ